MIVLLATFAVFVYASRYSHPTPPTWADSPVVVSIVLLVEVDTNGMLAEAHGRPAPMGITLFADRFAANRLGRGSRGRRRRPSLGSQPG